MQPLTIKVSPSTVQVPRGTHQGDVIDRPGVIADHQGVVADCPSVTDDCWSSGCRCRLPVAKMSPSTAEKGSRYEIVEAIDLDVWIFTPIPQWASTVMVCDNDLKHW
jgi:hypothetical protein